MHFESWPLISFILLSVILIIKIVWLKKQGIHANGLKNKKSNSKRWIGLVFVLLFLIWLFELIRPAQELEFSILPKLLSTLLIQIKIMQVAGAVLILLGLILFGIALLHFGSSLRFGLNENNRGKLITSGIFSFSRNPFFLALDIYFLGIAMVLPNIFFISFALLSMVIIHFFILKEEVFMNKSYGEEYREYRQKTRRYL